MKKVIFILTFISVGLFANASIGKLKKFPIKKTVEKQKQIPPAQWSFKVTCSNGNVITGCCYSTASGALNAGIAASNLCPVQ
jgi:hypothetical protein